MVAEPVQATLGTLYSVYDSVTDFVGAQSEKLPAPSAVWNLGPAFFGASPEDQFSAATAPSSWSRLADYVHRHRYESLCVLGSGLGLAGYALYRRQAILSGAARQKKRRTPKLPNGARRDVVLVVGSPTEPLTRLLALDFEKRGFIVYLTILSETDQKYLHTNTITDDVHYLNLSDTSDYAAALDKFRRLLHSEVVPIRGGAAHFLRLTAVVFAPNLYFPLGPVENVQPHTWEKTMARFHAYTRLLSSGLLDIVRDQKSKILSIVPNIVASLELSYRAPQAVLQNSIMTLFTTLAKELAPQGVAVTQIRLGNLNLSNTRSLPAAKACKSAGVAEAEVRSWSEDMQRLYGPQFQKKEAKSTCTGSPFATQGLRGLHHLLFDLIYSGAERNVPVVYYGSGARTYERLAALFPAALLEMIS